MDFDQIKPETAEQAITETTADRLKRELDQERRNRVTQAQKEITAILERHRCYMAANVQIVGDRLQSAVQIITQD